MERSELIRRASVSHGHALLATLSALLIVGTGAAGLTRWALDLVMAAQAQSQQEWAVSLLEDQFEFALAPLPLDSVVVEGTAFKVSRRTRQDREQGDPNCGMHLEHTLQWTDTRGHARTLALRTYACSRARAY